MTFTADELGLLGLALMKCHLLQEHLASKKFKLCFIAAENIKPAAQKGYITMILPFRFPETTDEQLHDLMKRIEDEEKLVWLQEHKPLS